MGSSGEKGTVGKHERDQGGIQLPIINRLVMKRNVLITIIIAIALLLLASSSNCFGVTAPQITIYVVPPISDEKILPDSLLSSTYLSNTISVGFS